MKVGISKFFLVLFGFPKKFFGFPILVEDKVVLHNTNAWENCDFQNVISYDSYAQLFLKFKGLQ